MDLWLNPVVKNHHISFSGAKCQQFRDENEATSPSSEAFMGPAVIVPVVVTVSPPANPLPHPPYQGGLVPQAPLSKSGSFLHMLDVDWLKIGIDHNESNPRVSFIAVVHRHHKILHAAPTMTNLHPSTSGHQTMRNCKLPSWFCPSEDSSSLSMGKLEIAHQKSEL